MSRESFARQAARAGLAAALAVALVPAAAFADGAGVDAGAAEGEGVNESGDEGAGVDPDDCANSWRYDNGVWMYAEGYVADGGSAGNVSADGASGDDGLSALAYQPGWNWPKVDGGYQSNDESVFPAIRKGIDVSYHQGVINWEKVKADGIDFAILRCGYVRTLGQPQVDKQWKRNAEECERLSIPYGVYIYSYAKTVQAAKAEADHVVNTLRGFSPSYPVYFDLEEVSLESTLNRMLLADMATVFCNRVSAAGYTPGVYANTNWWNNYLTDPVFSQWDRWVAQYNSKCTYQGAYRLWQCSSSGAVDGITGNVDVNLERDEAFATVDMNKTWVRDGSTWYLHNGAGKVLTGWQVVNGTRYYLDRSGAMQTGWVQSGGSWYYFAKSGAMKTGWVKSGGSWYYLDAHGKMLTGWQTVNGETYYLRPSSGAMVTGTMVIDGTRYWFSDSGALFGGSSSGSGFADVAPGAWYYYPVCGATLALGYMNGYGNGSFGPEDGLTRGQAACLIYNMAGGASSLLKTEIAGNDSVGYFSFTDVPPKAYYAKAVAWAKAAGIVNGYGGTGNFDPDRAVTREQLACMLWGYAKAAGSSTVSGVNVSQALASKKDGASVSGWARDGVGWAVANRIMGNAGLINPASGVSRAEAVAMAVNYQPEKFSA